MERRGHKMTRLGESLATATTPTLFSLRIKEREQQLLKGDSSFHLQIYLLCRIEPTVPESYVMPPGKRPGKLLVPPCKTIPVIDLHRDDWNELIHQIIKASQDYGFFQLTNHGVGKELMKDVLEVGKEFFELPVEEKERFYSDDPKKTCRLKTSLDYGEEKVHFWREFEAPLSPLGGSYPALAPKPGSLQIISNGKQKSANHRVVVNSNVARTTVVNFIGPSSDTLIQPANSLVNEYNPPL